MAGEVTTKVIRTITIGTFVIGGNERSLVADYILNLQKSVPANSTDIEFVVNIDVSEVKAIGLIADQNCTIETNNASSPSNTIALIANNPLLWTSDDPTTLAFFTVDVNKIFVTTGANATVVKLAVAIDSTPVLA